MVADVPARRVSFRWRRLVLVVALMQAESGRPVKTFTIKFDEARYDESAHARAVADHLRTDHTELTVTAADALAVIPSLPDVYDEPFSDSSQIPTYLVSKARAAARDREPLGRRRRRVLRGLSPVRPDDAAVEQAQMEPPRGSSVVRAGASSRAGAVDGTRSFAVCPSRPGRRRSPPATAFTSWRRILTFGSLETTYRRGLTHWADPEAVALHSSEASTVLTRKAEWPTLRHPLHRLMYQDSVSYLPDDIFAKVDRAAMAVSLETRAPLVDHRVVEFAWRIPAAVQLPERPGKAVVEARPGPVRSARHHRAAEDGIRRAD